VKPNKPAAIEPQQVQSKRNSTYHYNPSKNSVAALLQLLHALLQSKQNSTYHYKPSQSECKPRQNGESGQESGGARRHARACPVARPGGAQHATEPLKASYTSSLRFHTLVAYGRTARHRAIAYGKRALRHPHHPTRALHSLTHLPYPQERANRHSTCQKARKREPQS
jgi:hypothetical protein